MSLVNGRSFLWECENPEIGLHPAIGNTLAVEYDFDLEYNDARRTLPNGILAAISASADILRTEPERALIKQPFRLPSDFIMDTGATALAGILNGSLEQVADSAHYPLTAVNETVGVCADAEFYFMEAIHAVQRFNNEEDVGEWGVHIFTDGENPVLLRKAKEATSALTLTDVSVGGIPCPPGTILAVRAKTADGQSIEPQAGEVVVLPAERILGASIQRLSAFALNIYERRFSFRATIYLGSPNHENQFSRITMEDVGRIAAGATKRLQPELATIGAA